MGLILLSILSNMLFGALLYDWIDDKEDNASNDAASDPPAPQITGNELSYDGARVIEGSEGDDTLPAGQDDALAPDRIELRGGNDTAIIEVNDSITVAGGDGNDSITATGVLNILEGGAGNDTLSADDSNQLMGGEGNDVLNFTHGSYDQGDLGIVNGGVGSDTINIRAQALVTADDLTNVGGVSVAGGAGADEIKAVYELNTLDENQTPAGSTITSGFVSISDFTPGEDSLVIEVQQAGTEDRNVTVQLDQSEENGTYTSLITLTFAQSSDAAEATNILTITSNAPFTLADIELIGL